MCLVLKNKTKTKKSYSDGFILPEKASKSIFPSVTPACGDHSEGVADVDQAIDPRFVSIKAT